jgi:hypothetical protein
LIKDPKQTSIIDGKKFLQDSFAAEQKLLKVTLELSSTSITHDGTLGTVTESHFINVLRRYLPKRYCVDTGIAIDSKGKTSDQIDLIIYDNHFTPVLLDQKAHRYIPVEAIYAIFESKPIINSNYLKYAGKKASSVRILSRTTTNITSAGVILPPKEHFPIIAGIVAGNVGWVDGFGKTFMKNYKTITGNNVLDCGLAVSGHCFDTFNDKKSVVSVSNQQALIYFLFRFLQKLQSLGTVPAIDWNAYANILSTT